MLIIRISLSLVINLLKNRGIHVAGTLNLMSLIRIRRKQSFREIGSFRHLLEPILSATLQNVCKLQKMFTLQHVLIKEELMS